VWVWNLVAPTEVRICDDGISDQTAEEDIWAKTDWRTLHDVEFHDLYCSPNIIRAIKLRTIKLAWHETRM
jgi:hypothetical protein